MAKHMAPPEPRKPLGFAGIVRGIFIGAALLVGVAVGALAVQAIYLHKNIFATAWSDFPVVPSPQSTFHKDRIALLMLGIDYSYDSKDQEYSANARTDTIKTVALTFPTAANPNGSISILSVPRDTDVVMPDGHEDKINAAYGGYNNNYAAAAHNSEKVIAGFLGIPGFDRYMTLRIDATKDLVDAIGGIDVVPDETMDYDDAWGHLHIHFVGGKKYHMNGEQAVSYSRFRHDACSDPCRIKRQDQVIRLTVAKLKNDRFNDLLHINQLIGVVRRNVYTDLSDQEMLSLAWAFQHVDVSKLDTEQVPFVSDKDLACCGNVLIADDAGKNALVKKMFLTPLAPATVDPEALAQVNPATIHVEIENGSGVRGQGAKLAEQLRKKGYQIESVGNAASFGYDATEIHVHTTSTPLAGESVRAALAIKTATVQPDVPAANGTPASDVTVIVGRDYVAVDPATAAAAQK
jgi:polyisoprenyl-teichoic acid--peptidoglycan teichoic acid transferase